MIGSIRPNSDLVVKQTCDGRGRGVFAARAFSQGEVVEASPVWLVYSDWEDLPSDLKFVVYDWRVLTKSPSPVFAIALGVGSVFNHASPPNLRFQPRVEQQAIEFVALRDIEPGEELLIDYNSDEEPGTDWFTNLGVPKIG